MRTNTKPVYLYDLDYNLIEKFETTRKCAEYFEYEKDYINYNLNYCKKIRLKRENKWFIISRKEIIK